MADAASIVIKSQAALDEAVAVATIPTVVAAQQLALNEAKALIVPFRSVLYKVPFNPGDFLAFDDAHHYSQVYVRDQKHTCITTDAFALVFGRCTIAGGPTPILQYPRYDVFFGDENSIGVACGTYLNTTPHQNGKLVGSVAGLPDGQPYVVRVYPIDASGARITSQSTVPYALWVDRNGTAKDHADVIRKNGSFAWSHSDQDASGMPFWAFIRIPKTALKRRSIISTWFAKPSVDIPTNSVAPHVFPGGEPFNTPLPRSMIERHNWAMALDNTQANPYQVCITDRGILVSENKQAYSSNEFKNKTPLQSLLDGPLGVGQLTNVTSIIPGHGGSFYATDPHRLVRVNFRKVIKTLGGYRHKRAVYWEDLDTTPQLERVGRWASNIPIERQFIWECWAMAFDPRTTRIDVNSQRIFDPRSSIADAALFGPLPQHFGIGPQLYLVDRFDRLLMAQFDINNPNDEPFFSEVIPPGALGDPWGMKIHQLADGTWVISITERAKSQLNQYSLDDYRFLRTVWENPNAASFGVIDPTVRKWVRNPGVTQAQLNAQTILYPEGFAYQDGKYYQGSMALARVLRKDETTGAIEHCVDVPNIIGDGSGQPHFVTVSISPGSFGPRGAIATATEDIQKDGRPRIWLPIPGISARDGAPLTHSVEWNYYGYEVGYLNGLNGSAGQVYPMAHEFGENGCFVHGGSGYGLDVFMKGDPSRPDYGDSKAAVNYRAARNARILDGRKWYQQQGYVLRFAPYGWDHKDEPLPWGEYANCDEWLQSIGHVPPN